MNVCFVVTNLAGGGAEKAVLKIAGGLAQRGHLVRLLLLEHIVEHAVPEGVAVSALTAEGAEISKGMIGKRVAAVRLRRLFRRFDAVHRFDLVISTLPFADEVAVRAGLPRHWCRIANTLSAEIERLHVRHPAKARRRLVRYQRLYRQRPMIAVSQGVAADLRGRLGLSTSRIVTVYNPFDFDAIRAQAQEAVRVHSGPYVIHVGRYAAQKRHDLLLDAWARLDLPHRLVLLTPHDDRLAAKIDALGLSGRVTVAGFQRNPYPWIAGADLLVLCSDHEGLPNVIVEALALGTPVVSTDCPSGPREILGAAFPECLVPVGDAAALAQAIRRTLAAPPDTALADLSVFSTDRVLNAYERLGAGTET